MNLNRTCLGLAATLLILAGCAGRVARYDGGEPEGFPPAGANPAVRAPSLPYTPVDRARLLAFIRWRNRRIDPQVAERIADSLGAWSSAQQVDERLVACVVAVESSFDPHARSGHGALGLGQLLPGTARDLGVGDPMDIDQNLKGTTAYLAQMLAAWNGDRELALASYAQGIGNVRKHVQGGKGLTPDEELYVRRVLGLYDRI